MQWTRHYNRAAVYPPLTNYWERAGPASRAVAAVGVAAQYQHTAGRLHHWHAIVAEAIASVQQRCGGRGNGLVAQQALGGVAA
jgi:hypothetical protein